MDSAFGESKKIALLLSSLSNVLSYRPIITSVETLVKDVATRNCFTVLFIKERKSLALDKPKTGPSKPVESGILAASSRKN